MFAAATPSTNSTTSVDASLSSSPPAQAERSDQCQLTEVPEQQVGALDPEAQPTANTARARDQRRLTEARDQQVSALIADAHASCDLARRRRLLEDAVLLARPLASALARRYYRRGIDDADLEQVAMLGLCKAVRGFQPDRGVSFAAYAVPTIIGELKRHFRDAGWLVRPTRSMQEFGRSMRTAEESLAQRTGRHPSAVEVARFLDVSVQHVDQARQAERGFWAGSLDSPDGTSAQSYGATLADPRDDFEMVEAALVIGPAMRALTRRERDIVAMRFVEGLTQAEIGARIGVTQMQVSRLLRDVLVKLRRRIGDLADAS